MTDQYYANILTNIRKHVPDFHTMWEEENLPYLIVGEFYDYFNKNIHADNIKSKCYDFINEALDHGGPDTKELIEVEIFEHYISEKSEKIADFKKMLSENNQITFQHFIQTRRI